MGRAPAARPVFWLKMTFKETNTMSQIFFRARWQAFGAALLALTVTAAPNVTGAAELAFAGVIGNSGGVDTPARVDVSGLAWDDWPSSGVWVDPDGRVYLGGGRILNRFNPDGTLHRAFPLDHLNGYIKSRAFAVLDGYLYFFGIVEPPGGEVVHALFRLRLYDADAKIEKVADFPVGDPRHFIFILADAPRDGKLIFAQGATVSSFDPATKERKTLFSVSTHPGAQNVRASSLTIAPDGQSLYFGGYFGLYVASRVYDALPHEFMKLDWDGNVIWRRITLMTVDNAQFRGTPWVIGDDLWDFTGFGYSARYSAEDGKAKGIVTNWDMRMNWVGQAVDFRRAVGLPPLPGGSVLALSGNEDPSSAFLAAWDESSGELGLHRRLGSLRYPHTVGLSPGGWVVVNGFWWRFDDAAHAPPVYANYLHAPSTNAVFLAEDWYSALERTNDGRPLAPQSAFGRYTTRYIYWKRTPFGTPAGYTIDVRNKIAYASSADGKVWRTGFDDHTIGGDFHPNMDSWTALTGVEFKDPGSLAVLADGTLLVADGNELVVLEMSGAQATLKSRISGDWGKSLQVAADGAHVLVADTENHRVLLLDAASLETLFVHGEKGVAGAGANRLDGPGVVAIANGRAIVADSGNQRIVKFLIRD